MQHEPFTLDPGQICVLNADDTPFPPDLLEWTTQPDIRTLSPNELCPDDPVPVSPTLLPVLRFFFSDVPNPLQDTAGGVRWVRFMFQFLLDQEANAKVIVQHPTYNLHPLLHGPLFVTLRQWAYRHPLALLTVTRSPHFLAEAQKQAQVPPHAT